MRFQELSSASSALNQVGVTGIPPLQGSLLLQAYARKDEIERSFFTTSKVVTRKLTPSSLTAYIVQQDEGVFVLQKCHPSLCPMLIYQKGAAFGRENNEWFSDYLNRNRSTGFRLSLLWALAGKEMGH